MFLIIVYVVLNPLLLTQCRRSDHKKKVFYICAWFHVGTTTFPSTGQVEWRAFPPRNACLPAPARGKSGGRVRAPSGGERNTQNTPYCTFTSSKRLLRILVFCTFGCASTHTFQNRLMQDRKIQQPVTTFREKYLMGMVKAATWDCRLFNFVQRLPS